MKRGVFAPFLLFLFFGLFFPCQNVFAAIPIQEKSFQGAAAADARLKILSTAESYLGVSYRYSGLDRNGLDCSGLVYLSFREGLGITIPRSSERIYAWAEKIDTRELQPGDLVFFVTTGSAVSHLGIYAGGGRFIHSASEGPHTGVIYSRLDESYWNRTYRGAGRALPWNEEAAQVIAQSGGRTGGSGVGGKNTGDNSGWGNEYPEQRWENSGFFTGFGLAWTWGGVFGESSSVFGGISAFAAAGYKWSQFRTALELRPVWDQVEGIFRLPLTLSFGTDIFQVFGGPVYAFGEGWLLEAGLSAAVSPIRISRGALSFYGELAWQPYYWVSGENFNFENDVISNLRASTGVRYLWHF